MSVDLSGAEWFKSSHSQPSGDCVEVAFFPGGYVGVRDSKNPDALALVFNAAAWDAFTAGIARRSISY
ncbi:DUF397 domain-containing protein [Nocardia niwae]|uniref:DUF397 domain-containing protein n=1 Tax=Nocardia niwae TaxID=626084 RepID=UPI0007A51657|nr:DUF397 domain-containing protein [Nocardia niwae]